MGAHVLQRTQWNAITIVPQLLRQHQTQLPMITGVASEIKVCERIAALWV